MGFNKRFVNKEISLQYLSQGKLREYYGKSDMLIFDDNISSKIYGLYKQGLEDSEILSIIKQNMEEKTNEVY